MSRKKNNTNLKTTLCKSRLIIQLGYEKKLEYNLLSYFYLVDDYQREKKRGRKIYIYIYINIHINL